MTKYKVNNTKQFLTVLFSQVSDNDIIELLPGTYNFKRYIGYFEIKKSLTIRGISDDANSTKLNCAFFCNGNSLILQNLSVTYDGPKFNTIALYNHAELYGNNVVINRVLSKWDTVYCQNSTISLLNSAIMANRNTNTTGLLLEKDSQMIAVDTEIQLLGLRKSSAIVKDSVISYAVALQNHASLSYIDLTVDGRRNLDSSNFYIENNSNVDGVNLNFSKKDTFIDIINSNFKGDSFLSGLSNIRWRFDDNSTVLADGSEPFNQNN